MNAWALLLLNIAIRRQERAERRRLIGDRLLDAIRNRWDRLARRP